MQCRTNGFHSRIALDDSQAADVIAAGGAMSASIDLAMSLYLEKAVDDTFDPNELTVPITRMNLASRQFVAALASEIVNSANGIIWAISGWTPFHGSKRNSPR